jgi:hypothetical protein
MPLSTSSFEGVEQASSLRRRGVAVLLLIIAGCLVSFEVATRLVIERKSKVQRQVNVQYAEAIAVRGHSTSGPRQLLVIGNSLVGHGIDMDELRKDLPAGWDAHEFWVYNTGYDDWYFGLRRLFADGSRPDVVAIVFAAMHWNMTGIRGDYSSQYLFSTEDIPKVESQLDLDKTTATSLLLARFSKAYAIRSEVRKVLLNQLLPDLPRMYALFKPGPVRRIPARQILDVATRRMLACKELANRYGASLIAIVPPVPPPDEEYHSALREAAARAGVPIAIPLTGKDVPPSDFADDIHLSPEGATMFTSALARQLGPEMNAATPARGTN